METEIASLAAADAALEERPQPWRALYEHWDRNQWGVASLDFSADVASFARLRADEQRAMIWLFAHRFHAEFNIAGLLAPFLDAAPTYDVALLLATQVADEYRHLQCVLRIYEEVFGVAGGIEAVRRVADANRDPVAFGFYDALERKVVALREDRSEAAFLKAVVAYHVVAEGAIGRAAQKLTARQYEKRGFPGLADGQRQVTRDEARHVGIGVTYARGRMDADPEATRATITEVLDEFGELAARSLEVAAAELDDALVTGYGAGAQEFHDEILRLLQVRLRSIGYLED